MLLTVDDGIANNANFPIDRRNCLKSISTMALTTEPLTSEIFILKNVLATRKNEKTKSFRASADVYPGIAIFINFHTFRKNSLSTISRFPSL